jgi:hypothetical protein
MNRTRIAITVGTLALGAGLAVQTVPRADHRATRPVADSAAVSSVSTDAGVEAAAHGRVTGGASGSAAAAPSPERVAWTAPPFVAPEPQGRGTPWFKTPQAAMRYLATAYGNRDDKALAQVTTPDARRELIAMRGYAPALWLKACTKLPAGDYDCTFGHSVQKTGKRDGYARFRVGPAIRHGWYMTVLEDCGDGPEG